MKIFVDWVVRNEEQFLEKSLYSVLPYVDGAVVIDTGSTDRTLDIVEKARSDFSNLLPTKNVDIGVYCKMRFARNAGLNSIPKDWEDEDIWYMEVAGDEAYTDSIKKLRKYLEEVQKEVLFVWTSCRTLKNELDVDGNRMYYKDSLLRPKIYRYKPPVEWVGRLGCEVFTYLEPNGERKSCVFTHSNDTEIIEGVPHFKDSSSLSSLVVSDSLFLRDVVYEHYLYVREEKRMQERDRMYYGSQHNKPFTG